LYYSTNDKIKINPDGNLNMNMYAILNYERILSKDELKKLPVLVYTLTLKKNVTTKSTPKTQNKQFYKHI
jgi:hypothetical protein